MVLSANVYGSARERDMDLSQFVIMFRALFLEAFARPLEGVRPGHQGVLEKYQRPAGNAG